MEGHQQCKFPLVGSGGWTKVEFSTSGKVTPGAGLGCAGLGPGCAGSSWLSSFLLLKDVEELFLKSKVVPEAEGGEV